MNTSRGFIPLVILLIIVVLGGAGWYITNQTTTERETKTTSNAQHANAGSIQPNSITITGTFQGYDSAFTADNKKYLVGYVSTEQGSVFIDLRPLVGYELTGVSAKLGVKAGDTVTVTGKRSGDTFIEVTSLIKSPASAMIAVPSLTVTNVNPNGIELTVEYRNMPKEVRSLFLCIPNGGCTEWGVQFSPMTPNGTFTMTMVRPEGSTKTMGKGTFTVQAVDFATAKVFATSKPFTVQ